MSDLATIRDQWEAALAEGYARSDIGWSELRKATEEHGLTADLSLGVSLAASFAIMRGMQDTIDELRSRLAAVESKRV